MNTPILETNGRETAFTVATRSGERRRPAGLGRVLGILGLSLLLTGCLSRPALEHQMFALQTPELTPATNSSRIVLLLRPIDVSPLFASQALVYRIGPDAYETDPYASFLVPPGEAFAPPIRTYLANSGAYAEVVESGSLLKADRTLQIGITELYGDFRQSGRPAAVLSLRWILTDADGNVIRQKEESRAVPLKQNTATAVVAGYDEALAGIMAEVNADLSAPAEGH